MTKAQLAVGLARVGRLVSIAQVCLAEEIVRSHEFGGNDVAGWRKIVSDIKDQIFDMGDRLSKSGTSE